MENLKKGSLKDRILSITYPPHDEALYPCSAISGQKSKFCLFFSIWSQAQAVLTIDSDSDSDQEEEEGVDPLADPLADESPSPPPPSGLVTSTFFLVSLLFVKKPLLCARKVNQGPVICEAVFLFRSP